MGLSNIEIFTFLILVISITFQTVSSSKSAKFKIPDPSVVWKINYGNPDDSDVILTNCHPDPLDPYDEICEVYSRNPNPKKQKNDKKDRRHITPNTMVQLKSKEQKQEKISEIDLNTENPETKISDNIDTTKQTQESVIEIAKVEASNSGKHVEEYPAILKRRKLADDGPPRNFYFSNSYCLEKGEFTHPFGECDSYLFCSKSNDTPRQIDCPNSEFFDPFTQKCGKNVPPKKCSVCFEKIDAYEITEDGQVYVCRKGHPYLK